jgi:hypothetical protein
MNDDLWNSKPESPQGAEEPDALDPEIDGETPPVKRTLPPWAWIAAGLLAIALIIGAVAFAYVSGLSAGRDTTASGETTRTASGETSDSVDTSAVVVPTEEPAVQEPVAEEPAATPADDPPPSSTPTKTLTPLKPKIPKISKLYTIPTTWTSVFGLNGDGPWEMAYPPGISLKAGYLRMHLIVVNNDNGSGYVQLRRMDGGTGLPNNGILYDWMSASVVNKETAPVLIEAGVYQVRTSIHGSWSITLEQ